MHLPPRAQDILAHITKKEFEALLAVDQLNLEREKNKVFLQFRECRGEGTHAAHASERHPGSL